MTAKAVSLVLVAAVLAGCSTSPEASSPEASSPEESSTSVNLRSGPSPEELAQVQGFAFLEDSGWTDDPGSESSWLASDLSVAQARQAGVGALDRVQPPACEPVALAAGYGLTVMASQPSKLMEVGYAKRRSNSGQAYPTAGSIDEWESTWYQMPPGRAEEVARGLAEAWDTCASFTLVDSQGEQRQGERAHNLTAERGWAVDLVSSGRAVLRRASMEGPVGARLITVVEPIGDVLVVTRIGIWSADDEVWRRASELYNRQADQIAAGSARPPVDLCTSSCG